MPPIHGCRAATLDQHGGRATLGPAAADIEHAGAPDEDRAIVRHRTIRIQRLVPQDPPLRLVAELKKISSETKVSFTAEGALATPQERNSSTRPRQKEQKLW